MSAVVLPRPPRRVLVIAVPGFGDVLLATPMLRSLRRAYPKARVDVIVQAGREAALQGNPDVDRCIPVPKGTRRLRYLKQLARTTGRYDLSVCPSRGDRGVFWLRLAARRCVAVLGRTIFADWWKRRSVSAWTAYDTDAHMVVQHLRLTDLLAIERRYRLVPPRDPQAAGRLDEVLPFDWRDEPYAVLHVTTHATRKRWTLEGWNEVVRSIRERGWRCVFTGGADDDFDYIRGVAAHSGDGTVNVAGLLEFAQVGALIESSRLYIGPDTAMTHLAAAVGAPTLGIYGPGNLTQWSPWPRGYAEDDSPFRAARGVKRVGNVCVVQSDCDCGIDYRHRCGRETPGESRCLRELPGGVVIDAIETLVGATAGAG